MGRSTIPFYTGYRRLTSADLANPNVCAQLLSQHKEHGGWRLLETLHSNQGLHVAEGKLLFNGDFIDAAVDSDEWPLTTIYPVATCNRSNLSRRRVWTKTPPDANAKWTVEPPDADKVVDQEKDDEEPPYAPCLFISTVRLKCYNFLRYTVS